MEIKAGHGLRGYCTVWDILRKGYGLTVKGLLWMAHHQLAPIFVTITKKLTGKLNERV